MAFDLNDEINDNYYKWTSIADEPSFIIGREALTIAENKKYIIRHPINMDSLIASFLISLYSMTLRKFQNFV